MTTPLPVKSGLNPTRAQVPATRAQPVIAHEFVWTLIESQRHRHPDDDESAVAERFAAGEVVTDHGDRVAWDAVLRPGTWINFYRRPAPERSVPGEIRILYQNNDLVVIDKPPFLATLPRGQHIMETALTKTRLHTGIDELSPAHRLDRLTRGVLMFTARRQVRGVYQTLFDHRLPKKTYEAITDLADKAPFSPLPEFADFREWKEPTSEKPWILEHHMVKIRGRLCTYLTDAPANSVTAVTGVRQEEDKLVWTMEPQTGKTHQLRVALRSLGLPLLNDPLYGELSNDSLTRPDGDLPNPVYVEDEDFDEPLGLIAKELKFIDPLNGQERVFQSEY